MYQNMLASLPHLNDDQWVSEGVKKRPGKRERERERGWNISTIIYNSFSLSTASGRRGRWMKCNALPLLIASEAEHKGVELKSDFNCVHMKWHEETCVSLFSSSSWSVHFTIHLPIISKALERPVHQLIQLNETWLQFIFMWHTINQVSSCNKLLISFVIDERCN